MATTVVGLLLIACGFGGAASDQALLNDLREHGVRGPAVVTDVETHYTKSFQKALDNASVRFDAAPGAPVTEDLQIIDTVPEDIAVGDRVEVIFNPKNPSNVLLASAMGTNQVTIDYVIGFSGIAGAVVGLTWWILGRRERQLRRRLRGS